MGKKHTFWMSPICPDNESTRPVPIIQKMLTFLQIYGGASILMTIENFISEYDVLIPQIHSFIRKTEDMAW